MISNIKIKDRIRLKNSQIYTVHKIFKASNVDKDIYGLGLDPDCPGNFDWYYVNGKPVTYWANQQIVKTIFEPKTIIDVIRKSR